jgi:hypothetical protein
MTYNSGSAGDGRHGRHDQPDENLPQPDMGAGFESEPDLPPATADTALTSINDLDRIRAIWGSGADLLEPVPPPRRAPQNCTFAVGGVTDVQLRSDGVAPTPVYFVPSWWPELESES